MRPVNRNDQILIGVVAFFVVVAVWALLAPGCSAGLDGARQALSAAQRVQTESIKAFEQYDAELQANIVKAATSKAEGEKSLADYRLSRAKITTAILDAAAVTQEGAALIPLVELGTKKSADISAWLADLLVAGAKLHEALAQFGVPIGGAP